MRIQDIQNPLVSVPLQPGVVTVPTETTQGTPAVTPSQVNLFDRSSFQRSEPVQLADGSSISLPSWTDDDEDTANTLFSQVPETARPALNDASTRLATALYAQGGVASTSAGLSSGQSAPVVVGTGSLSAPGATPPGVGVSQASPDVASALQQATSAYVGSVKTGNYDQTVQAVSYMGVIGLQQQLGTFAQYVQGNVKTQDVLRTDQNEILTALSEWPAGQDTEQFTWHTRDPNTGQLTAHTENLTAQQAKGVADALGNDLQTMSDMNELDQMKLQDMTQKYQQGINTISNLLKFQHDTVKSIIQNLHS
jgi:hypothetical protein